MKNNKLKWWETAGLYAGILLAVAVVIVLDTIERIKYKFRNRSKRASKKQGD